MGEDESDVAFPLTPILSPGEREERTPSLQQPLRASFGDALPMILPLPRGEGRGEGERIALPSRALDVTTSLYRRAGYTTDPNGLPRATALGT